MRRAELDASLRYLLAAPWPHATALVSLCIAAVLTVCGFTLEAEGEFRLGGAVCLWAVFWLVVAFFAGADGISRNREYRRLRRMFMRYGVSERILETVARSRCQRDAALRAAEDVGARARAEAYFRSLGYRWYHILPDAVVRNPFVFLSPSFLRTSFMPGKRIRRQRIRSK